MRKQKPNQAGWDLAATIASDAACDIQAYAKAFKSAAMRGVLSEVLALAAELAELADTYADDGIAYQAGEYSSNDHTTGRA